MSTKGRKKEHIRVCLNEIVEIGTTWLEYVQLIHNLPDFDFSEIDTSVSFLGKRLKLPLMIAAMTGGCEEGEKINNDLAEVAEKKEIGFGLGSQRAMLEDPDLKKTYLVKNKPPLLLGNIGIIQLKEYSVEQIRSALDFVKADGLCIHINPAQELFQKNGDLNFSDYLEQIRKLSNLNYPLVAKEVGNGVSKEVALKLKDCEIEAIDVGGLGGTSWIKVDALISRKDVKGFENWGIPTAASILEAKCLPIIATGGIRTGIDIAKSIILGAEMCGIALPFLKILDSQGKEGIEKYIDKLELDLKRIMFLTNCKNIEELKKVEHILTGKLKHWKDQRV